MNYNINNLIPIGIPIEEECCPFEKNKFLIPAAIPFDRLREQIEQILGQVEGVRFQWNPIQFFWSIKFGYNRRFNPLFFIGMPKDVIDHYEKTSGEYILWVYWNPKSHSLYLLLTHFWGSDESYHKIGDILRMSAIGMFNRRSPYLSLISGTEYDHTNHVQRILFDAMYSRELCSWL
jgi:hypothetical protein